MAVDLRVPESILNQEEQPSVTVSGPSESTRSVVAAAVAPTIRRPAPWKAGHAVSNSSSTTAKPFVLPRVVQTLLDHPRVAAWIQQYQVESFSPCSLIDAYSLIDLFL